MVNKPIHKLHKIFEPLPKVELPYQYKAAVNYYPSTWPTNTPSPPSNANRDKCKTSPAVDSPYQYEYINYYPTAWCKYTTSPTSNANWDKFLTVSNRIRVNKLDRKVTQGDIHRKFSTYGPISCISPIAITRNRFSNHQKEAHCYITYFLAKDAQTALKSPTRYLRGEAIYVHQAVQKLDTINYEIKPTNRIYSKNTMHMIHQKYLKRCLETGNCNSLT